MAGGESSSLLLNRRFIMARIKVMDGGDRAKVIDYLAPITGRQDITSATVTGNSVVTVSVPTIAANDVVMCQVISNASANSYILNTVITANSGFTVTTQNGSVGGTLCYAVFHPNA
jgi:hypothetical protein